MIWTIILCTGVFVIFADTSEIKNDTCGKDYMVQIEEKWLEFVKQHSELLGWNYKEKIVSNIFLFECENCTENSKDIKRFTKAFEEKVVAVETRECSKLRFIPWLYDTPRPPGFKQWILTKRNEPKNKALSRSFAGDETSNGNASRLHSYRETDVYTSHGTKAAGLVAAVFGNSICSAGVAFNASIISLKVFKIADPPIWPIEISFPDDYITRALEYGRNEIDIYSCSFGLANMFAKSNIHIKAVLKEGITEGRSGKGSIYVFAAGNKGNVYDCNTVPYTNSIYTITIASVGKGGTIPEYSMPCSSVLASTYGIYTTHDGTRNLNTTTLGGKCDNFKGTSASAAIGSGIIALLLQANKNLTWRDVQHIVVMSSSFETLQNHSKTSTNGNGLKYNPYFGFGLMNATDAVLLARSWTSVPAMMRFADDFKKFSSKNAYLWKINFPSSERCLQNLEHVRVNVAFNIPGHMENRLEISLRSPAGTRSILFHNVTRQSYSTENVIRNWNFTSVQFWREKPHGTWTLRARFRGMKYNYDSDHFQFRPTFLTLYGTAKNPFQRFAYGPTENDIDCLKRKNSFYSIPFDIATEDNAEEVSELGEVLIMFIIFVVISTGISLIIRVLISCYMYMTRHFDDDDP